MAATTIFGTDLEALLAPSGPRNQPLAGFDATYVDVVDYILRCTHRIWEEKDIGLIQTHYGADCPIHTLTGTVHGVDTVVSGTLRTLSAFPDRTLYGEAVIWSGNEADGYLSSHRIISHATNLGASEFGPATGRRAVFTTIADCLCRENRIVEEWLVRDNSAIALQLGFSPRDIARKQADADRAGPPQTWRQAQIEEVRSRPRTPFPDHPAPSSDDPHAFAEYVLDVIWSHRRLGHVRMLYAPNARLCVPGGRRLWGWGEIAGWIGSLLAAFGDARMQIDHVASVLTPRGREMAVRWRFAGTHSGAALYGSTSQRPVLILAVSHWLVEDGLITEETTVFDEIAVLRQIEGGL